MKCIQNATTKEILRTTDSDAAQRARKGWLYVSKATWKAALEERDVNRPNPRGQKQGLR